MQPADLNHWLFVNGLNKFKGAKALGIARTTLDNYLQVGRKPIPKYIALACAELTRRFEAAKSQQDATT